MILMAGGRGLGWAALAVVVMLALPAAVERPAPAANASGAAVKLEIDPAAVPAGGTAVIPVRVTAEAPGIGGFRIDVHYDASRLTVLACTPASYCSIDVAAPQTVRLAALNFGGIAGQRVQVGSLTVLASGTAGQTQLLIDESTAQVYDTLANEITDAVLTDGDLDVVAFALQGDVDCSGGVQPPDALLVLQHSSGTDEPVPGCNVPGNTVGGLAWGDVNCDAAVDGLDALAIVLFASGDPGAPAAGCTPIGTPLPV